MRATTFTSKLNESQMGGFIRVPDKMYRKGLTPSMIALDAKIYSFTRKVGEREFFCHLTYKQAQEEFGFSAPTVATSMQALKERREIEVVERSREGTSYKYVAQLDDDGYDVIPAYLYAAQFTFGETKRKLVGSEIRVAARLARICESKRKGMYISTKKLAESLGLCEKTVRKCIRSLMQAGLLFRLEKGVNGKKTSRYAVHKDFYLYKQFARHKEREERVSKEVADQNARTDRERFYARHREKAQSIADQNEERARQHPEFAPTDARLRRLEYELAKAELAGDKRYVELVEERAKLRRKKAEILRGIGMTELDLLPQYKCNRCKDSGALKSGIACDCYKRE